jgi:dTDP-4-dehydrorhamnose 3,5-epimerase
MSCIETLIEGLYLVEGKQFTDLRGELIKPYSSNFLKEDLNQAFKEVWFTKSKQNVIRGMHLQVKPFACEKFVSVIDGLILDVIIDIRNGSKTYGQLFKTELSYANNQSLYIPQGCAHGYKVLSPSAIVMYMATEINYSNLDVGIRWDSIGFDWGISNPILSEKDMNLNPFLPGETYF